MARGLSGAAGLALALCALAAGACGRGATAAGGTQNPAGRAGHVGGRAPDPPQLTQIKAEPVQIAEVASEELVAPARVIANPNRTARVLSPVQGRVTDGLVRLASRGGEGQP